MKSKISVILLIFITSCVRFSYAADTGVEWTSPETRVNGELLSIEEIDFYEIHTLCDGNEQVFIAGKGFETVILLRIAC